MQGKKDIDNEYDLNIAISDHIGTIGFPGWASVLSPQMACKPFSVGQGPNEVFAKLIRSSPKVLLLLVPLLQSLNASVSLGRGSPPSVLARLLLSTLYKFNNPGVYITLET